VSLQRRKKDKIEKKEMKGYNFHEDTPPRHRANNLQEIRGKERKQRTDNRGTAFQRGRKITGKKKTGKTRESPQLDLTRDRRLANFTFGASSSVKKEKRAQQIREYREKKTQRRGYRDKRRSWDHPG